MWFQQQQFQVQRGTSDGNLGFVGLHPKTPVSAQGQSDLKSSVQQGLTTMNVHLTLATVRSE